MFAGRGEGSSKGARSRQACRDRCPQTADAGIYDGMGVLCPWFLREGSDRATADGVAASLGEREVRERAAKRYATKP